MTTTLALKLKNKVVFASDSAASTDYRIHLYNHGKFFKTSNGIVIGNAGSVREQQIVEFGLTIPTLEHAESVEHYMYRLANAIKSALLSEKANKDDEWCRSSFIVYYDGRLFEFDVDFQIAEHSDNYEAIGSGQYYAIGAMDAMLQRGDDDPVEIAKKAVETAIRHDPFSVGPVHFMEIDCPVGEAT